MIVYGQVSPSRGEYIATLGRRLAMAFVAKTSVTMARLAKLASVHANSGEGNWDLGWAKKTDF